MAPPAPLINDGNVVQTTAEDTKPDSQVRNSTPSVSSYVLHRSLHEDPLRVLSAQGNYLHLSNGQKIFDATGGAAVACLGHGNQRSANSQIPHPSTHSNTTPSVQTAIQTQMTSLSYCHSLFYSTPAAENLAAFLSASTSHLLPRVFIVSSGSEAMESALKLARQYHLEKSPPEPSRTRSGRRSRRFESMSADVKNVRSSSDATRSDASGTFQSWTFLNSSYPKYAP